MHAELPGLVQAQHGKTIRISLRLDQRPVREINSSANIHDDNLLSSQIANAINRADCNHRRQAGSGHGSGRLR